MLSFSPLICGTDDDLAVDAPFRHRLKAVWDQPVESDHPVHHNIAQASDSQQVHRFGQVLLAKVGIGGDQVHLTNVELTQFGGGVTARQL